MSLVRDKLGQAISVGDVIAYPGKRGDRYELRLYDVIEIRDDTIQAWKQGLDHWGQRDKKVILTKLKEAVVVTSLIPKE